MMGSLLVIMLAGIQDPDTHVHPEQMGKTEDKELYNPVQVFS